MPDLTRIPGVELIRTGRWPISSGSWDASAEDLVSAVAALNCPSIRRPVLKLGHVDPRFDGEPAIGYVDNLRVTDGGHTLVGDYAGVPAWLGSIAASAYPDRSVEGTYGFKCQQSHTHPFVLTAVALLGVTPPGVGSLKSLQDVAALYGVNESESGVRVAATVTAGPDAALVQTIHRHVGAAKGDPNGERLKRFWTVGRGGVEIIKWKPHEGSFKRCVRAMHEHVPELSDPEGYCATLYRRVHGHWPGRGHGHDGKVAASDNGGAMPNPEPSAAERIRDAFNASQPESRWIVEVGDREVIVIDDTDRSLHRVPVEVAESGVTFGDSQPVRMAYVPVEGELVAASRTVFASRAESRPEVPDAPAPDTAPPVVPDLNPPTEVPAPDQPAPLILPAAEPEPEINPDPKEDLVSTDLSGLRSRLGLPDDADLTAIEAHVDELKSKADTPPTPAEPTPEMVAASAAAVEENTRLASKVEILEGLVKQQGEHLAALNAEKANSEKLAVIASAAEQGKFTPAEREAWEARYDRAPDVTREILASIPAGSAVPVMASGVTGPAEPQADGDELGVNEDSLSAWAKSLGIDAKELSRG